MIDLEIVAIAINPDAFSGENPVKCNPEAKRKAIGKADRAIQAYKQTKAFRLAAIEYVIGMDWTIEGKQHEATTATMLMYEKWAKTMLTTMQEEIENEN